MTKMEKIAQQYSLKYYEKKKIAVGEISGVTCTLSPTENTGVVNIEINVNVEASEKLAEITHEVKALAKQHKSVFNFSVSLYSIKGQLNVSSAKNINGIAQVFEDIANIISRNGLHVGCVLCGEGKPTDIYTLDEMAHSICLQCAADVVNNLENSQIQNRAKKGNVPMGILGAFLGALIGGVVWAVFVQLGYIVAIAAFIAVVCSYKGYVMMSGKKDIKAIIISVVMAAVVIFLAHGICWSFDVYNAYKEIYEITYFDALIITPSVIIKPDTMPIFLGDLGIGYLFMAAGAFSFVKNTLVNPSGNAKFEKVEETEIAL